MAYIQQQVERLAVPLDDPAIETTGEPGLGKYLACRIRLQWIPQQGEGLKRQRCILHGQVEQRQTAQLDLLALSDTAPVPAVVTYGKIEITATQQQRAAQLAGFGQQRLRGRRVTAQRRTAGAKDPGFLESDRLTGVAQVLGMIDPDTGDQRQVRIHEIDRVQTTACSNSQNAASVPISK